jgi:hypothetical protein
LPEYAASKPTMYADAVPPAIHAALLQGLAPGAPYWTQNGYDSMVLSGLNRSLQLPRALGRHNGVRTGTQHMGVWHHQCSDRAHG